MMLFRYRRARTVTDCHRESSLPSKRSPRWEATLPSRLIFSGQEPVTLTAWRKNSCADSIEGVCRENRYQSKSIGYEAPIPNLISEIEPGSVFGTRTGERRFNGLLDSISK